MLLFPLLKTLATIEKNLAPHIYSTILAPHLFYYFTDFSTSLILVHLSILAPHLN